MSNYDQYMKHSKNHRKDRFVQQCSSYSGRPLDELRAEESNTDKETYWIENRQGNKIHLSETWDGIIEEATKVVNKSDSFIYGSHTGIRGRVDSILSLMQ